MKEFLSERGITFVEHDVLKDKEALAEMVRICGVRCVPVIVAYEQFVVGFDPNRLEQMINLIKNRSRL